MSHTQYTTPQIGCRVYASPSNGTCKPGSYIGKVIDILGNIVVFECSNGETDRFIWKFKDGKNTWFTYGP